jgi:ATP-dependent RNA helicase HelY
VIEEHMSAAERYAAAQLRRGTPLLEQFRASLSFDLDAFQLESCAALERGDSVLVAAPTGAGKTVVAEFAVYLAMQRGAAKVFYTAPMKALSNQKFQELVAEYGASEVGLLTGDTNINSGARIVVMTTEVLRNMLYADSDLLRNLSFVVMDEVHYLADRFRGAVWEEVIIHLPQSVRLVSLSATVSNAEEFGDWLQAVRGETAVIVSEERPCRSTSMCSCGQAPRSLRHGGGGVPRNAGDPSAHRVNPELLRLTSVGTRGRRPATQRGRARGRDRNRYHARQFEEGKLNRGEIVELLGSKNLLPAIFFIFSRKGCDQAVEQVLAIGCAPHQSSTSATRSARSSRSAAAPSAMRISQCSATGSGSTASSVVSQPTTPACCPRSRRSSRSSSRRSS